MIGVWIEASTSKSLTKERNKQIVCRAIRESDSLESSTPLNDKF